MRISDWSSDVCSSDLGPTDYRLDRLAGVDVWHVPNGPEATGALSKAFFQLTDYAVENRAKVPTEELEVGGGRTLHVPKSLKGVAVFSFKRLCGEARGAADYMPMGRRFHTVTFSGFLVGGRAMQVGRAAVGEEVGWIV